MSDESNRRKTGLYQNGQYLGDGTDGKAPEEPTTEESTGDRQTGLHQGGQFLGDGQPVSGETVTVDSDEEETP